jgi:hypothetical protein
LEEQPAGVEPDPDDAPPRIEWPIILSDADLLILEKRREDAAGDAALLARAVGKPVRVQWMRADEHGWDPKGAPTLLGRQPTSYPASPAAPAPPGNLLVKRHR